MGFAFNPFTGNFDQKGSGGGGAQYIDGEEAVYGDLSLDAGVAPLNSAWLVRGSSGLWPFNKPGGIYIRTATGGSSRDADYTYAGTMPDVFSDAVLTIYDEASTTRTGQFNLGSVTAGQNRVLTWPNANGTIARTEDFAAPPAIGNTTRNTVAATTMSATGAITGAVAANTSATSGCNGFQIPVPAAGGSSAVGMYGAFSSGSQRAVIFGASTSGTTSTIADFSANGLVASSIQDTPIGSTTANTGAFTTLTASTAINIADGARTSLPFRFSSETNNGFYRRAANTLTFVAGGSNRFEISGAAVRLEVNQSLNWVSNDLTGSPDLTLVREAADTLGQRRTTNAQASLIYGSFTSATAYQRLAIRTKSVTLSGLSGASVATTGGFIPDGAVLVGLTTRVSTAITGATGYDIGDGTDADRWGANIGVALNTSSDNTNWTAGTIECFTAAQEVTLTAVGSNFNGGAVVIVAHYLAGEAD